MTVIAHFLLPPFLSITLPYDVTVCLINTVIYVSFEDTYFVLLQRLYFFILITVHMLLLRLYNIWSFLSAISPKST